MAYLKLGTLELDHIGTPPRSGMNRSRTRMVRVQPGYDGQESWWDFGDTGGFSHTFASAQNVGHLTPAEVQTLMTLEANKAPFTLITDLFQVDGQNETFTAYFDPETKPVFTPAVPGGTYWVYELSLYLIPQGG